MNPPQAFLDSLKAFDKDGITEKQKSDLKTPEILNNA